MNRLPDSFLSINSYSSLICWANNEGSITTDPLGDGVTYAESLSEPESYKNFIVTTNEWVVKKTARDPSDRNCRGERKALISRCEIGKRYSGAETAEARANSIIVHIRSVESPSGLLEAAEECAPRRVSERGSGTCAANYNPLWWAAAWPSAPYAPLRPSNVLPFFPHIFLYRVRSFRSRNDHPPFAAADPPAALRPASSSNHPRCSCSCTLRDGVSHLAVSLTSLGATRVYTSTVWLSVK